MVAEHCLANKSLRYTGRHLVLLRDGLGRHGTQPLANTAGLRMEVSSDRDGQSRSHIAPGEGLLFHQVGAALVHPDPDQLAAIAGHARTDGSELIAVEPERHVWAIQLIDNAGANLATEDNPPAFDETENAWGLQTTRVTMSRFTGRGVRVAILDTGLDSGHPDFNARTIVTESFVPNENAEDKSGHGTYCAGVACGPASPSQQPRYGVACGAEIYVGKVIADDGSGTDGGILAGIDWAVRSGCCVVSLSVGSPVAAGESYSTIYEQAAQRALASGTLILAAAGNDSLRPDTIAPVDHPANCPSIMAIAAIDEYLRIASFSCGGVNASGGEVDLAAPGVAVRSAWPRPHMYRMDSGTSMATPFAAGIAALMAEANAQIRGRDLMTLLTRSALPLAFPTRDTGAGLIQAP